MDLSIETLRLRADRLEELNQHLTFRLSHLSKLLEVDGSQRLAGSSINLTGYRIMLVIHIFEEISVSDLSRVMLIDRAQISRAAADLIKRGLLFAGKDKQSERKKLLSLTEEGLQTFQKIKPAFDQRHQELMTLLGKDEFHQLLAIIDKMSEHLNRN